MSCVVDLLILTLSLGTMGPGSGLMFHRNLMTNRRLSNSLHMVAKREAGIRYVMIEDVDMELRGVRVFDSYDIQPQATASYPPVVVLGGTAQTISTFIPHIRHLSATRRLIIPELRCQGQTELLSYNGTMRQHVTDVENILNALEIDQSVDLVGFSFGGRIAMAVAAHKPYLVSKISVTGVPWNRPPLGAMILKSWYAYGK